MRRLDNTFPRAQSLKSHRLDTRFFSFQNKSSQFSGQPDLFSWRTSNNSSATVFCNATSVTEGGGVGVTVTVTQSASWRPTAPTARPSSPSKQLLILVLFMKPAYNARASCRVEGSVCENQPCECLSTHNGVHVCTGSNSTTCMHVCLCKHVFQHCQTDVDEIWPAPVERPAVPAVLQWGLLL